MGGLEILKFTEEGVEFAVGNLRRSLPIVEVVVALDLGAEVSDAFGGVLVRLGHSGILFAFGGGWQTGAFFCNGFESGEDQCSRESAGDVGHPVEGIHARAEGGELLVVFIGGPKQGKHENSEDDGGYSGEAPCRGDGRREHACATEVEDKVHGLVLVWEEVCRGSVTRQAGEEEKNSQPASKGAPVKWGEGQEAEEHG